MLYTVQTVWADGTGSLYTFPSLARAKKFCALVNEKCRTIIWNGQAGGMRVEV